VQVNPLGLWAGSSAGAHGYGSAMHVRDVPMRSVRVA